MVDAEVLVRGAVLPTAGAGARCSREVVLADVEADLRGEVARWLAAPPGDPSLEPLELAQDVTQQVRWVGTHHLTAPLLADLAAVRSRHRGTDRVLDAFLDCVLAKHDGRYWNRTYLCLPVLELLVEAAPPLDGMSLGSTPSDAAPLDTTGLSALLAADVIRHELCASSRGKALGPLDRPDGRTLRTRVRHAVRFMTAHLGAEVAVDLLAAVAHTPEATLPELLEHLPVAPAPRAAEWLALTVQPVSVVHDETFFIRALQAHEMVYTGATSGMRRATAALRGGHVDQAAELVRQVTVLVSRGASLFRMVATLRPQAFFAFRDFTTGASAIQSEQYKRFELACGVPPASRSGSAAFSSVPAVAAEAAAGPDTMTAAHLDVGGGAHLTVLTARLRELEGTHLRWKATHVSMAERILGDAGGSGYTEGVPYLRAWEAHRLFWALDDVTV